MKYRLYTGSYATDGTPGIQTLVFDTSTGALTCLHSYCAIERPSYLGLSPDGATLYAVSETSSGGAVYALRVKEDGSLSELNSICTSGGASCHLAVDPQGQYLLVSNYISGILDVFQLAPSGAIIRHTCGIQFVGFGPNRDRQKQAHAHFASFFPNNLDRVIAVDLGSDLLRIFMLNRDTGILSEAGRICVPPGYGPRHLVVSKTDPNIVYVVCELSLRILTIRIESDSGHIIQDVSCIPADYDVLVAGASAIKQSDDGGFIYASTRIYEARQGKDCVVCYTVNQENKELYNPVFMPLKNSEPRDLNILGEFVLSACQSASCIEVMARTVSAESKGYEFPINRPSCIIYAQ